MFSQTPKGKAPKRQALALSHPGRLMDREVEGQTSHPARLAALFGWIRNIVSSQGLAPALQ